MGTLAFSQSTDEGYVFFVHQQAHAFLAFVADDFFGRQRGVTNGQLAHINLAARAFHQFGKTVQVTPCAVVVDGNDGVLVQLTQCTDDVSRSLLHFGVGALYSVQFNAGMVLAGIDRRHGTTTHTDAVVIATQQHHFMSGLGFTLKGVYFLAKAYTAGQHNDLVVGEFLVVFSVFKG